MLYRDDEEYITLFGIITYDELGNETNISCLDKKKHKETKRKKKERKRDKYGRFAEEDKTDSDITNSKLYDILTNRSEFATKNHLTKEEVKNIVNDRRRSGYCRSYINAIKKGDLQPTVPFKVYEETLLRARRKLIGFKIFDDMQIKSVVNHISERIIGDGKDRLPMSIETIKDCLRDSNTEIKKKDNGDIFYTNKKGVVYFNSNYKLMTVVGRGKKW